MIVPVPAPRLVAIAVLSAGVIAAGCGGSGDDPGATATGDSSLSKSQFITAANRICKRTAEKIVKASRAFVRELNENEKSRVGAELRLVHSLLMPTLKSEIEQIRALPAPTREEAEIEAFLAAMEEALAEGREEPLTYVTSSERYRTGDAHFGRAAEIARRFGLSHCPQG